MECEILKSPMILHRSLLFVTIAMNDIKYVCCFFIIKTHGSESRGQGGSTLRRPLDERT